MVVWDLINRLGESAGAAWLLVWWVALPLILLVVLRDLWLWYVRSLTVGRIEWVTLELLVPEIVLKTPKAMEQVFASVYSVYSFGIKGKLYNKYLDGKIESWISFEMVGIDGGIHFYIRTPHDYVSLIETAIYSQFPDAEINQVDDYMERLPAVLPNQTYDLWASDMGLVKDDSYPIKTYPLFEEDIDERRIDPVANIAEVMGRLKEGEYILIQFVISPIGKPTGQDLEKQAKEIVEELATGNKKKLKPSGLDNFITGVFEFVGNLLIAPFATPTWGEEVKEEKKDKDFAKLSKGVAKTIEAVEMKVAKPLFEASIRVIYIDRRDSFSPLNVAAIMGYFSQYNTPGINSFKPAIAGYSSKKLLGRIIPVWKNYWSTKDKVERYRLYRSRSLGLTNHMSKEKLPVFSTEEMATLFHFPITGVVAPSLERLGSKKGEPPIKLPIK